MVGDLSSPGDLYGRQAYNTINKMLTTKLTKIYKYNQLVPLKSNTRFCI